MDQQNKVVFLTDELIITYTGDNVLTEYRDINMSYSTRVTPYPGGVYDSKIFGSVFSNRCNCGQIKIPGIKCPRCGSMILDPVQAYRRYARIELPIYYCSSLKFTNLIKFLRSNLRFVFNTSSSEFASTKLFSQRVFDTLQFNYKDDESIEVTDEITDVDKCSYEGLLTIFIEHYPDLLDQYRSYINSNILVTPIVMRPPHFSVTVDNKLENEQLTTIYKNIIYATENYYKEWFPQVKTESGKAIFNATFRKFITKITDDISRLLKPSKENLARQMQSTRINNSGRCTIVPAPNINIDEVYIPRHLIYDCCKDEFIEFLKQKLDLTTYKAEILYSQPENQEVQDLFKEYIEGEDEESAKYVFILRNPTLHEMNILMSKVKLTNDYCMKIPMAVCKSFNADFDGDAMAFFAVPKNLNSYCLESMSPKNLIFYKKDHSPLFTPTHEIMMGLILATKVKLPEGELKVFEDIDEAKSFRKLDKKFKYQTKCLIGGKETTLAREILGNLFNKDINSYIESLTWDRSKETPSLTAKNCIPLYSNLSSLPDRVERIQKIQEFALLITTISGSTAPKISEIYRDIDSELLLEIQEIENNDEMTKDQKDIKIRELYSKFVDKESSKYSDLKIALTETSRAKISQLHNIVLNQLNVGPDKIAHVSKSRLIEGMNPTDYARLAIENRATQDIKVDGVPLGGYLTRQFSFLAQHMIYRNIEDPGNEGIWLPKKEAIGRTQVNGELVTELTEGDKVKVRSIITSTLDRSIISKDMIPNFFKYRDNSIIGISLMTSLTEGLTQSSLGLKHGGNLFGLEPNGELRAFEDMEVEVTPDYIICNTKSKQYTYPKPSSFQLNFSENNRFKKGELIGIINIMKTPTYVLDCTITLCGGARVTAKKSFARNKVQISDCYACKDGVLHYKYDREGMHVFIDDEEYEYNPEALYLYPDGTKVKKYDRICSGIMDINIITNHVSKRTEVFYFFYNQFKELHANIKPELIELVYTLITALNSANKVYKQTIRKAIKSQSSFFTALAFQSAKQRFKSVDYEGQDLVADTFARIQLQFIFNDSLK